ncbi:MAG: hypothetical protein RBT59_01605 [Arcobacteraceae bacterium]|nr:hypothetical protein [Arcobacteraceae bacterium]
MQTIQVNIADDMMGRFIEFLNILPQGSCEIKQITNNHLDSDPYFDERKKDIQKRLEDIDSGKLELKSFEIFENEMAQFEKELELRYAN